MRYHEGRASFNLPAVFLPFRCGSLRRRRYIPQPRVAQRTLGVW